MGKGLQKSGLSQSNQGVKLVPQCIALGLYLRKDSSFASEKLAAFKEKHILCRRRVRKKNLVSVHLFKYTKIC